MTEDKALQMFDLINERIFGWTIVLSISPDKGGRDGRTRRCRDADELFRDLILNQPDFDDLLACLIADGDPVLLWPESLREVVRFEIDHKVPRDLNEPTSAAGAASRVECGQDPLPDWLMQHGKAASIDEHPPFPARTPAYKAMMGGKA